jgi:tRNA(Ile2) C34 agmatinyltransferase TiaS
MIPYTLYLGLDSFDDQSSCTSYIRLKAIAFLKKKGFFLIEYPYLLRLNPDVPSKTRGNGALKLILRYAKREGVVPKVKIGFFDDSFLYSYEVKVAITPKKEMVTEVLTELYAYLDTQIGGRGLSVATKQPSESLYYTRLRSYIRKTIIPKKNEFFREKERLIGARRALARPLSASYFFECRIFNRQRKSKEELQTLAILDKGKGFFSNYDFNFNETCCLIKNNIATLGVKSTKIAALGEFTKYCLKNTPECILLKTNERQDLHVLQGNSYLQNYRTYCLKGVVTKIIQNKGFYKILIKLTAKKSVTRILFKKKLGLAPSLFLFKKYGGLMAFIATKKNNIFFINSLAKFVKQKITKLCCNITLKSKNKMEEYCKNCKFKSKKLFKDTAPHFLTGPINTTRALNAILIE